MNMTETSNQEKYILLNNDSDLEELDKSKASLTHPTQKGRLFSRSHKIKKFSSSEKLQRFCHVFFVVLILISQIFLSCFVLKTHQDLSALKQMGAVAKIKASFNLASEQRDIETINIRKEEKGAEFRDLKHQGIASIETIIAKNTEEQSTSAKKNETGIHTDKSQQLQNTVDSKMNEFEKRLENVTTTLNNLQKRLQENTLTVAKMEQSNSHTESPTQPFQENEKKVYSSGLPYITPSQNYNISEPTSQDSTDKADAEILEEKPKIIISFIKNLTDLQIFFYGADNNANGYLTYREIQSLLGEETPQQEQLELFDADHNQMYSYAELIRAFGLTE